MTYFLTLAGLQHFMDKLKAYFVKKETGKGLSSNDFTDDHKEILDTYGDDIPYMLCMDENGDFYVLETTEE